MSWNTLSARDKSAFMNVALRHGVTDLAAIKRVYDSLGGDNVMAGGGPAKTKEPPFSLAQRAAENRLRKAHLFDDGGQEDVIDWGNVDLKAMRDAYQQSQEDNVRTYTAVPASSMSYNEGNGLWWNKDTGTWHSQDSLTFPSNKEYPVTVVYDRNTGKDFAVPSSQYVRPLNTQDYFDHTGSNALEFASLMTSPTNLFMPSHVAGAIWDTYDKLSGKNPNVNLWDSWLHENRGIGRTNNPYLNLGLNLAGDMFGYGLPGLASSVRRVAPRAALEAERAIGFGLYDNSKNFAAVKEMSQWVTDKLLSNLSGSGTYSRLARGAANGFQSAISSAADAAQSAFARPGLYLLTKYNKARDQVARKALERMFIGKQDYLSRLAHDYGYDYVPEMSPSEMTQYIPIDYSGKTFRGPHGTVDEGAFGTAFWHTPRKPGDTPDLISINPANTGWFSNKSFARLMEHEGTHVFDDMPSTKDLMYNIAAREHPEYGVRGEQGAYKRHFAGEDVFKQFADAEHREPGAPYEMYYPEMFSRKLKSVMPIASSKPIAFVRALSDIERNAVLSEVRSKFINKLGLDPLSSGFDEDFANRVRSLPDEEFFSLRRGSKPRFTVFNGIKSGYTNDWMRGLTERYNALELDDDIRRAWTRNFIDTMKDLLVNYRALGGGMNKFDGLDNLDRPNQMATAFDDLVAARDRYAQTGDINTSWEPVDLNDVSITDNGFITREGRTGNSFVLPEATIIGQRPVVNEATLEEESDDNSFLGGLRAARNRVKYGHSALTEEDKAMTRRANKVAAAGSAAIAGSVLAPYLLPYAGTALNAMQPSTYLDAIASGLGAQVGNYGLGASTMAGALGNAALASEITAEGLGYLYNTYLAGNNQRSLGEDANAALALAPFLAAPAAGAKKLLDLSRSGRLMTRLEHANRLTRYLSAPHRAKRYLKDNRDYLAELIERVNESKDRKAHLEQLRNRIYAVDKARSEAPLIGTPAAQIDLSKASKKDIQKYLDKHAKYLESQGLSKDFIEFNENGEPLANAPGVPIFDSGKIGVPVFGTGETKTFNITDISNVRKNLHTDAVTMANGKQYDAKELADYYKLTRDNIKYVEKATGGKAFGSSALVGFEEVPHATHDYDVLVTEEMADKKMPGWRNNFHDGLAHYQLDGGKYGRIGDIDVNVIEEGLDGNATGTRAMELFRQFFPEEYGKEAEAAMLRGRSEKAIKITKTPQELLDAYDPVTKTVMDALEIDYTVYRKDKHATRILGYLAYSQNPKSVAKGIDNFAKMLVGKDYRPAPKLNFSDREANIRFLDKMFGKTAVSLYGIADSPERMQNLFDMFYLDETTYVRELGMLQSTKARRDMALNLWPNTGGTAHGKLVNAVKGNRSWHGDQVIVSQIPVKLKKGESLADAWEKISRATGHKDYKFTAEDLAADSRLGEYLGIKEGDTASDVLYKISHMSNAPITDADNVLRDPEKFQDVLSNPFYPPRERAADKRARIASEILKENEIYGLEDGNIYINGPYMSVVENLPYVSRQNLYWPGAKSFRSLTQRAKFIRDKMLSLSEISPMIVKGHNSKERYIKSGITAMQNDVSYEKPEPYMPLARKKLGKKIGAADAKTRRLREAKVKQGEHMYVTHPLLGGKSLSNVAYSLGAKKNNVENDAVMTAAAATGVAFLGTVAYSASKKSKAKDEAFGQALINLYGEDYYKNFSEDNPGADYNRFINEHKDELKAEVNRLMRERRHAEREKKSKKK